MYVIGKKVPEGEREQLISQLGLTEQESIKNTMKIGKSSKITGITTAIAFPASLVGIAAMERVLDVLNFESLPTSIKSSIIAGAVALEVLAVGRNARRNHRLNMEINNSPNVFATTGHLLFKNLFPDNERMAAFGSYFGTFAPVALVDIISLALFAFGPEYALAKYLTTVGIYETETYLANRPVILRRL